MALWGLSATVVWNKGGRSRGRPQEEWRGKTPVGAIKEAGEAGTRVLPESGLGARGSMPGPRPLRPARDSPRIWQPAQPFPASQPLYFYSSPFDYYYYSFPRKAGTRDCPNERRRGRHFPGKAQRASAPGAPEREPEGSARPRTLLRAGRGLTATRGAPLTAQQPPTHASAARVPGLTFSGAAHPRTPVPSLLPAPPRPFHCQPGAAGTRPGHPLRPPERPCPGSLGPCADHRPGPVPLGGRGPPFSPSAPPTPHLQEPFAPSGQPRPGLAARPRIPPPSLNAQDAPGSSPATGILPLL